MKNITKNNLMRIKVFAMTLLIAGFWQQVQAQITWGPFTTMNSDQTIATYGTSEWVNMDMYGNSVSTSGTFGERLVVIVWDEYANGSWTSYYYAYDQSSGWNSGARVIANDSRHPDVIIGDHVLAVSGVPGAGYVAFVYEDAINQDIYYNQMYFSGMLGMGTPNLGSLGTPQQVTSGNGYDEFDPHIDAYFSPSAGSFFSSATLYEPLGYFVITWTENNTTAGSNQIYVLADTLGTTINGTVSYLANGERSDIAGVMFDDGTIQRGQAHVIYVDPSTGYPMYLEYDVSTSSVVGSPTTLNSTYQVSSGTWPRIDGRSRIDTTTPATTKEPWIGVAQLDSIGGRTIIESYNGSSGPGLMDNYNTYPGLSRLSGYNPAICTGPGPDDYFVHHGLFGTDRYQMAWYIDKNEIEALQYDDVNAPIPPYEGYYEVNTNTLSSSARPAPFAVSTSSNNGSGFGAAWYNNKVSCTGCPVSHYIGWKQFSAFNIQYEPASGIESIEGNTLTTLPNPAAEYVKINGLEKETEYKALDLQGKLVLQGSISTNQNTINISQLPAGTYIFHVGSGEETTVLKLIKK